jgi:hypothetical protein
MPSRPNMLVVATSEGSKFYDVFLNVIYECFHLTF